MMSSAATINGLYAYALTLDNPVNLRYTGHTIAPNGELAFDPPESGRWSMLGRRMMRRAGRFFGTPEGQLTAAFIYVAAIIKTWGKATPLILMSTGAGAWISGAQAGNRARDSGDDYWDGFTGYITDNWAQSAAISGVLIFAAAGIGMAAKGGFALVGSAKKGSAGVTGKSGLPNQAGLKPYLADKDSYARAIEGNPSFGAFRQRYWIAEVKRAPGFYGTKNVAVMLKGRAPIMNGEKLVMHHVNGRGPTDLFNVVILPESQHIAFHQMLGYSKNDLWKLINW